MALDAQRTVVTKSLPRAYERTIELWMKGDPNAGARATRALERLLGALLACAHPNPWRSSALTMTGSPLELAFAPADPSIRYTVEPSTPELRMDLRLDHVVSLLARLGASPPEARLLSRLRLLQAIGPLRYGAQLGCRHDAGGDRYKLYVELPRETRVEAERFAAQFLAKPPVLEMPGRDAHPTLLGADLATGDLEVYYRIEDLHPAEISTLLGRADMSCRAPELLELVKQSQIWPLRHALPGRTWGFSYAQASGGTVAFSLYTFARTLFGPDGRARDAVLRMAAQNGWNLGTYAQMSEPLVDRRKPPYHHGIFGLVARPAHGVTPWIGLAPPEPA